MDSLDLMHMAYLTFLSDTICVGFDFSSALWALVFSICKTGKCFIEYFLNA